MIYGPSIAPSVHNGLLARQIPGCPEVSLANPVFLSSSMIWHPPQKEPYTIYCFPFLTSSIIFASMALTDMLSSERNTTPFGIKGPSALSDTARKMQERCDPKEELEQYRRYSSPTFTISGAQMASLPVQSIASFGGFSTAFPSVSQTIISWERIHFASVQYRK